MKKLSVIAKTFISLVFSAVAGIVIYQFWSPIATWYYNYRPVLGVDFYSFATFISYLTRNFVLKFNGWKYIWWGGTPLSMDYPMLHAYLILPLLNFFNLPHSILIYMLASTFLFLFFSYLLFTELGKDRVLAVVLTIATSFSIGLYGALVWGGSLNYYATQAFLPLTLWLFTKFVNSSDRRWFYLSAGTLGISIMGHPGVAFSFGVPMIFLILLFTPFKGEKYFSLSKIKRILTYFLVTALAGYPQLSVYLGKTPLEIFSTIPSYAGYIFGKLIPSGGVGQSSSNIPSAVESQDSIAIWRMSQLDRFIRDIHPLFYVFLGISAVLLIIGFLVRKKRTKSLSVFVYLLPALWIIFYAWLFAKGIAIFQGEWFRMFWAYPVALGMIISAGWGSFFNSTFERFKLFRRKPITKLPLYLVSAFLVVLVGYPYIKTYSATDMIFDIETSGYRQGSSAYPDVLNFYIDEEDYGGLGDSLKPTWIDSNDTQYRFYDSDQRINIWWNALYDMPLVKGYIEVPPGDATGAYYWTSIAITSSGEGDPLVEAWGNPEEIAFNNALFLLDWFSIKYIEAEHTWSDSFNPLNTNLAESDIFENKEKVSVYGWGQLYEVPQGEPLKWHPEVEQYLTYYGVKESLISPIAHTTDAKVIGVIGGDDNYQTILRNLAAVNLNSRYLIPVKLGKFIDKVSEKNLEDMDAVILYGYDYKNHSRSWSKLSQYVENGGKVFIDTGSDVKQTDSVNLPSKYPTSLPSLFPLEKTKQGEIGKSWSLSGKGSEEAAGIDFSKFGPPVLDEEPWLFSLPSSDSLREGAKIILANRDIPLVVSRKYGDGMVIWSGLNLPFHVSYHKKLDEALFFKNLLESLLELPEVSYGNYTAERLSPNKVSIEGSGSRGVLFRENAYPVWGAKIKSAEVNRKLNIYNAGPTHYGFSYVRIPDAARESFTVNFSYKGIFWDYFWTVVWVLTILAIIDRAFLGSKVLVPVVRKAVSKLKTRVGRWWEREDEY